jgi:hypothetical protein
MMLAEDNKELEEFMHMHPSEYISHCVSASLARQVAERQAEATERLAAAAERQAAAAEAKAKCDKAAEKPNGGWLTKKQAAAHEGFSVRHFDALLAEGIYPPGERRNPRAHARWSEKHLAEGRARYAAAGEAQRKRLDKIMGTA